MTAVVKAESGHGEASAEGCLTAHRSFRGRVDVQMLDVAGEQVRGRCSIP